MEINRVGALARAQEFTATGTWIKPGHVQWIDVILVGGGGSGGGGDSDGAFSGGGGGGGEIKIRRMYVTANVAVTIGAGGAAVAHDVTGNVGVASTLATGCTLSAAGGGLGAVADGSDGAGGDGGGLVNYHAANAADPATIPFTTPFFGGGLAGGSGGKSGIAVTAQYGASSVPGFGAGGATGATAGGGGGGSYGTGGKGNAGAAGTAAAANTGAGGGGGGDSGEFAGAAGGSGYCLITWIE